MRLIAIALSAWPLAVPGTAEAQAKAGWGNVGEAEEKGFAWTDPLWPEFWMAWTPATLALFVGLFAAIAAIGVIEALRHRDGLERKGIFGLTTTLGDRLFITLLGSVYIFLAWLGLVGQPVWAPLAASIGWGFFVFRKV